MEPAKAGNDEEDEMHPVPAKVMSIRLCYGFVEGHTSQPA